MKKKGNNKLIYFLPKSILFLVILSVLTVVLSIGYAAANLIVLEVESGSQARVHNEVFITDAQIYDQSSSYTTTSTVDNYYQTVFYSTVNLDSSASDYEDFLITVKNNTSKAAMYDGMVYDRNYFNQNNDNIVFEELTTGSYTISQGYVLNAGESVSFIVRFKYKSGYTPSGNNTISSMINFRFAQKDITATFVSNGGTIASSSTNVWYGSGQTAYKYYSANEQLGTLPTVTRAGYDFNGWFDSSNNQVSTTTVITANKTITAHWTAKTYTISFDSQGGTPSVPKTVTYDQPYGSLPYSTKANYVFGGWYTPSNQLVTSSTIVKITSDTTLTAKWNPDSVTNFDYTGGIQTYTVPTTGYYTIQTWGSQGGGTTTYLGGYGAYSTGQVYLTYNQTLYIVVGGAGNYCSGAACSTAGGYNGGGGCQAYNSSQSSCGSGGGATHVATQTGVLSSLSANLSKILIVSGGGGGANYCNLENHASGGSGGGMAGVNSVDMGARDWQYNGGPYATGGNQSSGSAFGQGAGSTSSTSVGGGGGFYGGKNSSINGAGGGSGYIANTLLTSKHMYCYNCSTSTESTTYTNSNGTSSCHNSTPTTECSKEGNGYVKISFDGADLSTLYTVSFNGNGGTPSYNSQKVQENGIYGTLPTATRAGYTFNGWYYSGNRIYESSQIVTNANHTLTASWTAQKYTVSFNSNGGSSVSSKTVTYGSQYGTLTTPTKTDNIFLGWYNENNQQVTATSLVSIASNHTLTARWKQLPRVPTGMIPVTISDSGTVTATTVDNSNWANYDNKQWGNGVLVKDSGTKTRAQNSVSGTTIASSDILAYYVYIPRYEYKIWTTGSSSAQTIEIRFTTTETITTGNAVGQWLTHPAFWWDNDSDGVRDSGEELDGIWVGKFETTCPSGNSSGTSCSLSAPEIIPNGYSVRSRNTKTMYEAAQKINYGLSSSNADSHMAKNVDWGAMVYLSHSAYGLNAEIEKNRRTGYITGCGNNTSSCKNSFGSATTYNQSSTGNISGIFDINGSAFEDVMAVYNKSIKSSGFSSLPAAKYYDNYTSTTLNSACNGGYCFGHALSETKGWYDETGTFLTSTYPWLIRGGYQSTLSYSGPFNFNNYSGTSSNYYGFRSVIIRIP